MKSVFRLLICLLIILLNVSVSFAETIVIGSKNFSEQFILGEILAQTIEAKTKLKVERKFNLGGTQMVVSALRSKSIDIYPEYTGTSLLTLLKEPISTNPEATYNKVQALLGKRFGFVQGEPFGFQNVYAVAVRRSDPRMDSIQTNTDFAKLTAQENLSMAIVHEFLDRPDGFQHFKEVYNLSMAQSQIIGMDPGLMYTAIHTGQVDSIMAYSTDGRIQAFNLKLLEDDQRAFPPYEAVPLTRVDVLKKHPELKKVFSNLSHLISDDEMIKMNYEVDYEGYLPRNVARNFLIQKGIIQGKLNHQRKPEHNFFKVLWNKREYVVKLLMQHLMLTTTALALALIISLPLGIILTRARYLDGPVFAFINLLQTIPSLALLGFLIPVMGIGFKPAIMALLLYALLPLVRNTYIGIREVDPSLIEACRGMGLTDLQILKKVELPLALPTIMAGVRTSMVILVGTATLVALIGAGGLGDPIFRGISSVNTNTILLGAVPAAALAITLDQLLHFIESRLRQGPTVHK
jgi:osmoprotectant transport system permease protein